MNAPKSIFTFVGAVLLALGGSAAIVACSGDDNNGNGGPTIIPGSDAGNGLDGTIPVSDTGVPVDDAGNPVDTGANPDTGIDPNCHSDASTCNSCAAVGSSDTYNTCSKFGCQGFYNNATHNVPTTLPAVP